jgi:hypothetical protein
MAEIAGGAAKGLLGGVGDLALKLREAITGDLPPEVRGKLAELAAQAEGAAQAGQLAINLEEAKSTSLFVAGWRPFIGWTCGSALAYNFILQPFLAFIIVAWRMQLPPLPVLDMASLLTVLSALLGLSAMRTYEKVQRVEKGK